MDNIIAEVESLCQQAKVRLTEKRKELLALLLQSKLPLSAYELADRYQQKYTKAIPVMSVYRILAVFLEHNLVHKLTSSGKYIACTHILCDHDHQVPQFLICEQCESVSEVGIQRDTIQRLEANIESSGFALDSPQIELYGVCKDCQVEAPR